VADYPDPENFLFLLASEMSQTRSGGPNTANFADPEYDALFRAIKDRENGARRLEGIRAMQRILERERPWIELFHPEDYALVHDWLHGMKPSGLAVPVWKYQDVDPALRAAERSAWNRPVRWPAYALAGVLVAFLLPGVQSWRRERQ
jgi:ABC-type oligopeptide transport system substrate-binding subunit